MSATDNGKQQHRRSTRAAAMRSGLNARRGCANTRPTMSFGTEDGRRGIRLWKIAAMVGAAVLTTGCSEDAPHQAGGGTLSGQVVVSGPLRKAMISVDQLDYSVKSSVAIRAHVADTMTDDDGRFSVDTDTYSGLLLVTAKGGTYTDLATGATIQLDPNAGLESIEPLEILEQRDDALVSPVGALLAARTRWKMPQLHDLAMAERDAEDHLNRHFGGVPWTRVKLSSLSTATTSPTEAIRAGLVHAALSYLAADIAQAAGASPQEVNVLSLTQQLAADIGDGPFDGNDGNAPAPQGLQLGVCAPLTNCTAPPGTACTLGACRPLCDLYAGTPRALLAGEVTKVIQSPAVNHTGLVTGDILAIARSMADNVDDDLFQNSCLENLDRLPPKLDWVMPTPADGAFVRAAFRVKAAAVDDTDPHPQVIIDGFPNEPADSAASAMIDTVALKIADGVLPVTAEARDLAGNTTKLHRTITVDNTPPSLVLASTGFLQDGSTWWTATASPTLTGTVGDAAPVSVATSTGAGSAPATVTGSTWSGGLAGALDLAGADVVISATDAAGNTTQVTQHIRADLTLPNLALTAGDVRDEANEAPTFDDNEIPVHIHTGARIDLTTSSGCPVVTKFSYLLAGSPPYANEVTGQDTPDPNPLHYVLRASDDGVGVVTSSIQYRVGYQAMGETTWLLDWTSATGTPSRNPDEYDVKVLSDQVPQLATTEGTYQVEFRATDRLMRTATMARCFELRLRAPPLHVQTPGDPGDPIVHHTYELASMALGSSSISARLLNDNNTGASLIDEDVTNGTGDVVYLDVSVAGPTGTVTAGQQFQINWFASNQRTVHVDCTDNPDNPPPAVCTSGTISYLSTETRGQNVNNPSIFVKVFELDGNQLPTTELSCQTCGVSGHWKFAIPARPGSASAPSPPRRFKVMTMIGQIAQLWPTDTSFPALPPFRDTALNGVVFTGLSGPAHDQCIQHSTHQLPDGTTIDTCTRVATFTPFRALIRATLTVGGRTTSQYSTAPTQTANPVPVIQFPKSVTDFPWISQQTRLPCTGITC
jgi:hypothetical protein